MKSVMTEIKEGYGDVNNPEIMFLSTILKEHR
jgi:hypothetical protein